MFHGEGSFAFIMGIISGYPVGAKIVSSLKGKNICTSIEAERLIAFTNNSGPLFIIGSIGISLFYDTKIGLLLFITHLFSCITVGILFRWWKFKSISTSHLNITNHQNNSEIQLSNLGEVLSNSILKSINTILLIGGFIVLFSVVCSIIKDTNILLLVSKLFGFSNIYFEGIVIRSYRANKWLTNSKLNKYQIYFYEYNNLLFSLRFWRVFYYVASAKHLFQKQYIN